MNFVQLNCSMNLSFPMGNLCFFTPGKNFANSMHETLMIFQLNYYTDTSTHILTQQQKQNTYP